MRDGWAERNSAELHCPSLLVQLPPDHSLPSTLNQTLTAMRSL